MGGLASTSLSDGPPGQVDPTEHRAVRLRAAEVLSNRSQSGDTPGRRDLASEKEIDGRPRSLLGGLGVSSPIPLVQTSPLIFERLIRSIGRSPTERLAQFNLDDEGMLVGESAVTIGCRNSVPSNYRAIVESALRDAASHVILAHNHPSGSAIPSEADRLVTRRLVALLNAIGIRMEDHIIVTHSEGFSMKLAGMI